MKHYFLNYLLDTPGNLVVLTKDEGAGLDVEDQTGMEAIPPISAAVPEE